MVFLLLTCSSERHWFNDASPSWKRSSRQTNRVAGQPEADADFPSEASTTVPSLHVPLQTPAGSAGSHGMTIQVFGKVRISRNAVATPSKTTTDSPIGSSSGPRRLRVNGRSEHRGAKLVVASGVRCENSTTRSGYHITGC